MSNQPYQRPDSVSSSHSFNQLPNPPQQTQSNSMPHLPSSFNTMQRTIPNNSASGVDSEFASILDGLLRVATNNGIAENNTSIATLGTTALSHLASPSVSNPAPRCVLARNIMPETPISVLASQLFSKCGTVQHVSDEYLKSDNVVICRYYDIRHAHTALERLQNRTYGRNKVTVEAWEAPDDVLHRVFPTHQFPISGRVTLTNLSTKMKIDSVRAIMSSYGQVWKCHMGPINYHSNTTTWTAILEYCDIRDAGRAYTSVTHEDGTRGLGIDVQCSVDIRGNNGSIRSVSNNSSPYNSLEQLPGLGGSTGHVGQLTSSNPSNIQSNIQSNIRSNIQSNIQPNTQPNIQPNASQLSSSRSTTGSKNRFTSDFVQQTTTDYMEYLQQSIMKYQQQLMNDMSQIGSPQQSTTNTNLQDIQQNFQIVLKAQSDVMVMRNTMNSFLQLSRNVENILPPSMLNTISQQHQQHHPQHHLQHHPQHHPQHQQRQQYSTHQGMATSSNATSNGYLTTNARQQHSKQHQQQYHSQHQEQQQLQQQHSYQQQHHQLQQQHQHHQQPQQPPQPRFENLRNTSNHESDSRNNHTSNQIHSIPTSSSSSTTSKSKDGKKSKPRPYALQVDDIISGKDQRTTIMVRNIPMKYTQQMVMSEIEETFSGLYDFFYLPMDSRRKCAVGYAFINFRAAITGATFYAHFNGRNWPRARSNKKCNISYGRIQGKKALIEHFRDSTIMKEENEHVKPVVFDDEKDTDATVNKSTNNDEISQIIYTSANF